MIDSSAPDYVEGGNESTSRPSEEPLASPTHHDERHHHDDTTEDPQVTVVDPNLPKIRLLRKDIIPTLAFSPQCKEQPSLCLLFLKGKCSKGARCHQVHANADTVGAARAASQQKNRVCCYVHAMKPWDNPIQWRDYRLLLHQLNMEINVAFTNRSVGLTQTLEKVDASTGVKAVELWLLCRNEFMGGVCRYGEDCHYLHLCRELRASIDSQRHTVQPPPPTLPFPRATAPPFEVPHPVVAPAPYQIFTPSSGALYQPFAAPPTFQMAPPQALTPVVLSNGTITLMPANSFVQQHPMAYNPGGLAAFPGPSHHPPFPT